MKKSSIAPRKKGSWIKDRLRTNEPETTKTESETTNIITRKYLEKYFNAFHPKDGTALNIIASLDDPNLNKINLIEGLISQGANKYKALEFAFKNNNAQAEYLLNNLTFEPNPSLIQAIQNQSLTLVKYFIEKKGANVNFSHFGSNTLSIAAGLEEPYKTDIIYYLLTQGATPSNRDTEEAGQNVTNFYKQIFFKAVNEQNFVIIKNIIENTNFHIDATNLENTALSIAINFEDKEIANYLISKKADTTAAISAAATQGNLDGIKLLLEAGANIDGNKNESPITLASEHGYTSVVKYLLEHGAKHNIQGWCGGATTTNLYTDVDFQVKKLLILWEEVNNTNIEFPELITHFQKMLDDISLTSISSTDTRIYH